MGSSERVRVGLAGLGRFGKLHAAVLGEMAGVELAAVCDPQPDEVAAMMNRYQGARGFADFEEMLDNANLDAVFIVTRNRSTRIRRSRPCREGSLPLPRSHWQ